MTDSVDIISCIAAASAALSARKEEINRLNVFPVPDGDTGTNMSLTLESVVREITALPKDAGREDLLKAVTHGSLMGARGNSGVITSQILRGLCEGLGTVESFDALGIAQASKKAVDVAFQAVRKPVEGTILTVLRDSSDAAAQAAEDGMSRDDALHFISEAAFASVKRTPELLPVLKENGVVDAGGFGLSILIEAFVGALTGEGGFVPDAATFSHPEPQVAIEQVDDWEGSAFRYCNEFLVDSETLDAEEALDFLQTMGDCELCVGSTPKFKVHVHSNTPDKVLAYFLERGQISEVFIHNMQLQSEDRDAGIAAEAQAKTSNEPPKPIGYVAVAAGSGMAAILESLGVDTIVSGGQTMNPSTADLLDAVNRTNADAVVILPNNKNIIMAAQAAAEASDKPVAVVATKSVPAGFAAMFAADAQGTLEGNVEDMNDALEDVKCGEVTHAIKDAKAANGDPIKDGDVIGIADDSITCVGDDVGDITLDLIESMADDDADTLTILAGEDMDDASFEALCARIEEAHPDLEIDHHRGEQPLYPIVLSVE